MTKHATYQYTGEDNAYGLKHGKQYNLAIYEMNWFERLFSKYPVGWHVVAYRPFERNTCLMPYGSYHEFNESWSKVKIRQNARNTLISV